MLLSQLAKNERGFAMAVVITTVALAAGLAVYVMQNSDRGGRTNERDMATFDRENLLTEMKMILSDPANCKASLEGSFRKSQIRNPGKDAGHKVELWTALDGARASLKLKEGDTYYKLQVSSLRLFMNKGAETVPEGTWAEQGLLRVRLSGSGEHVLDVPLTVNLLTGEGLSTIIGCRASADPVICDSMGMLYDELKGNCYSEDVCDDVLVLANDGEEDDWMGERKGLCMENVGSHIRDIAISQKERDSIQSTGNSIRCCYPRNRMSVRCHELEEIAEYGAWEGDLPGECDMKPGGILQMFILGQGEVAPLHETTTLMIRCCYPYD